MKVVLLHAFPFDETMWEPQREALDGHDVVAPNLYALGGNSIDGWAQALLEVVEGRFAAVGASMGGYVALAMARRAPERVRGLLLVGSRAGPDTPERRLAREELLRELSNDGLYRATEALRDRPDASDVVRSYPGPFMLVAGADDDLLPEAEAREIVASAPQGRLEVVEDAGHIVNQDQRQRFNALLREFLEWTSTATR
jgi:pimeloyl-ACP methyl ester carboxylesterase